MITLIYIVGAIMHAIREARQGLADFLCALLGVQRRWWLGAALTTGALLGVAGPLLLSLVLPQYAAELQMFAAGALLGDAVITHLAVSWLARRWAPGTLPDFAVQLIVSVALALDSTASAWWAIPGALQFVGLWLGLAVLLWQDASAGLEDRARGARTLEEINRARQLPPRRALL